MNEIEYVPFEDVPGDEFERVNLKAEIIGFVLLVVAIVAWAAALYLYTV